MTTVNTWATLSGEPGQISLGQASSVSGRDDKWGDDLTVLRMERGTFRDDKSIVHLDVKSLDNLVSALTAERPRMVAAQRTKDAALASRTRKSVRESLEHALALARDPHASLAMVERALNKATDTIKSTQEG